MERMTTAAMNNPYVKTRRSPYVKERKNPCEEEKENAICFDV
jgi:hypothetical protein